MHTSLKTGACLLAILTSFSSVAEAATAANCANADEFAALRAASVQQTLMNAGLGCGTNASETHFWMGQFNAFQTAYRMELRKTDALMLAMFKRMMGNAKGDAAYNAFKTRLANDAGLRRVRGMQDFCNSAASSFNAALGSSRPKLAEFVAGAEVKDTFPVAACDVRVAAGAEPSAIPRPRPEQAAAAPQH